MPPKAHKDDIVRRKAERLAEIDVVLDRGRESKRPRLDPEQVPAEENEPLLSSDIPDSDAISMYQKSPSELDSERPLSICSSDPSLEQQLTHEANRDYITALHLKANKSKQGSEEMGVDWKKIDEEVSRDSLLLWLEESPDICKHILSLQSVEVDPSAGWCTLAGKRQNKSGYARISWGGTGGHDLIQIHWVALLSVGKRRPFQNDKEGEPCAWKDASHLCGRANCFNPDHLEWEGHQANMDRRNCLVWVTMPNCTGCGEPQKKLSVCTHDKGELGLKCVKYCEGFADHHEFQRDGLIVDQAVVEEVAEKLAVNSEEVASSKAE